ncbi:hypothetical protein VNO77_20842 [Canavalia gladiata]|uniref:Uncharacterized protein n=1 Tax=Canavalia gladiata TaxID=3824 RepID=A0AAN9LV26_CANGL
MCELLTGCLSFLHCLKLLEDSPLNKIDKVLEDQDGFYGISCTLVLRLPICQTAIALALPDQKLTIAKPKRVLRQTARLLVRDFNKGEFYIKRLDPSQEECYANTELVKFTNLKRSVSNKTSNRFRNSLKWNSCGFLPTESDADQLQEAFKERGKTKERSPILLSRKLNTFNPSKTT